MPRPGYPWTGHHPGGGLDIGFAAPSSPTVIGYPVEGADDSTWTSGIWTSWSAWQQQIAATPGPGLITKLRFGEYNDANTKTATWKMFQIGIGPSGSERVLSSFPGGLPTFSSVSSRQDTSGDLPAFTLAFPLYIPPGSRISVRSTGDHSSVGSDDKAMFQWQPLPVPELAAMSVPYVANPVPKATTSVEMVGYWCTDPMAAPSQLTGVAGSFGSWQVVGTMTEDVFITHVSFKPGYDPSTLGMSHVQFGVGPSGSEVVIVSERTWMPDNSPQVNSTVGHSTDYRTLPVPQFAPKGTIVSGRAAFSSGDIQTGLAHPRVGFIRASEVVPITAVIDY